MERGLTISQGLKELLWVQEKLKLALEEKDIAKVELEQQKELQCELRQALTEEAKRRADEKMERLEEEVQLYKIMMYQQGYHDGTQGKTLRYPFDDEEQPLAQKNLGGAC